MGAQYRRHPPDQRRQDRPVGPVQLRPRDLTPQHRDFVAEDHDLRILGTLAAAQQHQPTKDPDHEQIEEPERHRPRSCLNLLIWPNPQVTSPPSSSDAVHVPRGRTGPGARDRRARGQDGHMEVQGFADGRFGPVRRCFRCFPSELRWRGRRGRGRGRAPWRRGWSCAGGPRRRSPPRTRRRRRTPAPAPG